MNFAFNEEQEELRKTVRAFLEAKSSEALRGRVFGQSGAWSQGESGSWRRFVRFEEDFGDFEVISRQVAELGLLSFGLERVFQVGCCGSVVGSVRRIGGCGR